MLPPEAGVVVVGRSRHESAIFPFHGRPDQEVGDRRVLGQQRTVQVAGHHVAVAGSLVAVLAVVPCALGDCPQRLDARAEGGLSTVVLVAQDVSEFGGLERDIADQPLIRAVCFDIEDTDPGNDRACAGLEELSEELVETTYDQHWCALVRELPQMIGACLKIILNNQLAAVLPAAAHDDVNVLGKVVAYVVFKQLRRVAIPLDSLLGGPGSAPVTVNIHVPRVQLEDADGSFGGLCFRGHETTSTMVILASSRRIASMAVYVQKIRLGLPREPSINACRAAVMSVSTVPKRTSSYCKRRAIS